MIETLAELDRDLFLWLNELHAPWLDPIMIYVSETLTWLPLHAVLLYLIYRNYGWKGWPYLIALALSIVLADQLTSALMKPYFQRLRPSHDPLIQSMVHIVDGYRGGKYGFASSHAANTFAAATFLFLLLRRYHASIILLFAWATLVTYSRIYLGVHYPGDVIVGAMIGCFLAIFLFWLTRDLIVAKLQKRSITPQ